MRPLIAAGRALHSARVRFQKALRPESQRVRPARHQVKQDSCEKKRDRKMNQNDVLRVLGEQGRSYIPWIHRHYLMADGYRTTIFAVILG
jgi:hypothetical protein